MTLPILRLTNVDGKGVVFWFVDGGRLLVLRRGRESPATAHDARRCGTTLAAIRAQLLEMEESK